MLNPHVNNIKLYVQEQWEGITLQDLFRTIWLAPKNSFMN